MSLDSEIWILYHALSQENLLSGLTDQTQSFSDEPKFPCFTCKNKQLFGAGIDKNKKLALLKALSELAEKHIVTTQEKTSLSPETYGSAGGFDQQTTIERAVYEAIERQAYRKFWQAKIIPPAIRINQVNHREIQTLLSTIKQYRLVVDVFDITIFFQAEDGIRDWSVTGVQTCALPI